MFVSGLLGREHLFYRLQKAKYLTISNQGKSTVQDYLSIYVNVLQYAHFPDKTTMTVRGLENGTGRNLFSTIQ